MLKSLSDSQEWQEIKSFLLENLKDKPLDIKIDGMDNDRIALELRASQLATAKVIKLIKKFERQTTLEHKKSQKYI